MEMKHTPGPWRVVLADMVEIRDEFDGVGAQVLSVNPADAPLMAAAPELMEALQALVKLHHDWFRGSAYVTVAFEKKNDAAIAQALAAINKAIGA